MVLFCGCHCTAEIFTPINIQKDTAKTLEQLQEKTLINRITPVRKYTQAPFCDDFPAIDVSLIKLGVSFGNCRLYFASAQAKEGKTGDLSAGEHPPVSAEFYGGDWESAEVNSPQVATPMFYCSSCFLECWETLLNKNLHLTDVFQPLINKT